MTSLELTEWWGVDERGPFIYSFGAITGSGAGATMTWARIAPDGTVESTALCTQVDADTFTASGYGNGRDCRMIAGASIGSCDLAISGSNLTLTMDSVVQKVTSTSA